MGNVPTTNLNAYYATTTPGNTIQSGVIDPALQDIVQAINDNFALFSNFINPISGELLIPDQTIVTRHIRNNAITNPKYAALSITADKLADGSITLTKLAELVVTAAKIANFTITEGKMANGSVSRRMILPGVVGANEIDPTILNPISDATINVRLNQIDEQLADITLNIKSFGAVGDGVTDNYQAIMAAHDALPDSGGNILVPDGVFKILQGLVFIKRVCLLGKGYTTNEGAVNYAPSCILKDGNFDAITFKKPGSMIKNMQIAGSNSDSGDGIVLSASRCVVDSVSVTNLGRDGLRIGDDIGSNTNLWRVTNLISLANTRHAVYVHHGPAGLPDTNAGVLVGLDARGNGGDGIALGNTIDNSFYGVCCQVNGGCGVRLYTGARGNKFFAPYCEANTSGEFIFDAGTRQNLAFGSRQGIVFDGYINNGSASNLIIGSDGQQTDYPFYVKTPLSFKEMVTTDNTISGVWRRYQNATDRALTEALTGTSATPISIRDAHENGGVITREVMQLRIGAGSIIKAHYWSLGSRDFAPIAAQSTGEVTITVNGAAIGDTVFASPNTTIEAGLVYGGAWVSAVNTVTIRLGNITAATIDPAARGWYVDVWHH